MIWSFTMCMLVIKHYHGVKMKDSERRGALHSAYDNKLQRSSHLPPPAMNCMSHRQALSASAAKIIR
jgi:hypothetical protein